jgi:hypothetical protein
MIDTGVCSLFFALRSCPGMPYEKMRLIMVHKTTRLSMLGTGKAIGRQRCGKLNSKHQAGKLIFVAHR